MDEQLTQQNIESPSDEERLEELFHGLWDRVKQAGELIAGLRSQNAEAHSRLQKMQEEFQDIQRELTNTRKELLERNATIKELQQQMARNDGKGFGNGEKEALAAKARELLARIEGYL